jgi:hypothetical protein
MTEVNHRLILCLRLASCPEAIPTLQTANPAYYGPATPKGSQSGAGGSLVPAQFCEMEEEHWPSGPVFSLMGACHLVEGFFPQFPLEEEE